MPLDPWLSSSSGVKLCTYQGWFARPAGSYCPNSWDVPMGTSKLQRIFRFRMGSHMLPIEQDRHLQLPRHRRVCKLCHAGVLGDERHLLLECPALANVSTRFSQLIAHCSAAPRDHGQACVVDQKIHHSLPWHGFGPLIHTLFHPFSFVSC